MTTASLTVIDSKNKKELNYFVWHDGYQVDTMLEDAKKRIKLKKFTEKSLEDLILRDKENGFENWFNQEAGEWHWTLVILDENHAILTGGGNDDIRTSYWEV